jgi:hypothetical protein
MVQVREARRLFRLYRSHCFWWAPETLSVTRDQVAWVATYLRRYGGRDAWRAAAMGPKPPRLTGHTNQRGGFFRSRRYLAAESCSTQSTSRSTS